MTADDLDALAAARLADAATLFLADRYEGARYVCGYAIELKLKARICRVHGWAVYPPIPALGPALKTHNFEVLLMLSAQQSTILTVYKGFWGVVASWSPDMRYYTAPVPAHDAHSMIEATRVLLAVL